MKLKEFNRAAGLIINEIDTVSVEKSVKSAIDKGYPLFRGEELPDRFSRQSVVSALTPISIDLSAIYILLAGNLEKIKDDIHYTNNSLVDMSINCFKTLVSLSYTGNLRLIGNKYENHDILFYDTADKMNNAYEYNGLLLANPSVSLESKIARIEPVNGIYNSISGIFDIDEMPHAMSWIGDTQIEILLVSVQKVNTIKFVSVMPVGIGIKEVVIDGESIDFDLFSYFGTNIIQFDERESSSITLVVDVPPVDVIYGGRYLNELINSREHDLLTKKRDDLLNVIPSSVGGNQCQAGYVKTVVLRDVSVEYNQYYRNGYAYFDIGDYTKIQTSGTASCAEFIRIESSTTIDRVEPAIPILVSYE